MAHLHSDVPGLAWPENHGLGLASEGSGLGKNSGQAKAFE